MLIMLCENKLHFQAQALTPFVFCSNVVVVPWPSCCQYVAAAAAAVALCLPCNCCWCLCYCCQLIVNLPERFNCAIDKPIGWSILWKAFTSTAGREKIANQKYSLPLAIIAREKLFRHCAATAHTATIVITFSVAAVTETQLCSILLLCRLDCCCCGSCWRATCSRSNNIGLAPDGLDRLITL